MKQTILFLLLYLPGLLFSQSIPPRENDYEALHYYKDSIERHQNPILKYQPHRCQNRYAKYGWVGKNHRTVIPFEYNQLPAHLAPLMSAVKNNQHGAIDSTGRTIVPFRYDAVNVSLDQKRCYAKKNRWGAWNASGKQIIPEKYNEMMDLRDTLIRAYDPEARQVVVFTKQGEKVFSIDYQAYWEIAPGRFCVCRDAGPIKECGVLDAQQNVLIPVNYLNISWVRQNWAALSDTSKQRGLFHIPTQEFKPFPNYSFGMPDVFGNLNFNNNKAGWDNHHGLMDSVLRVIYPPVFYAIRPVEGAPHYILTTAAQRSGIGDREGHILLDTVYSRFTRAFTVKDRSNPMDMFSEGNKIDLPFWFFGESDPSYPPRFAGLWHNRQGLICLPDLYEKIYPLSDRLYMACNADSCFLKSVDGQTLSKRYKKALFFQNRFLLAQSDTGQPYEVLEPDGQVSSSIPEVPEDLGNGFFAIRSQPGYALYNETLTPVTDHKYMEIRSLYFLEDRYQEEMIRTDASKGYARWVAWGKESLRGPVILFDTRGKTYTIKE